MTQQQKQMIETQARYMLDYSQEDVQNLYAVLTPEEKVILDREYTRLKEKRYENQHILNSLFRSGSILIDIAVRKTEAQKAIKEKSKIRIKNLRNLLEHEKLIK
ncbi:MAG: hypothetical protein PHU93_01205 [Candidatus Gracilibacteria bacterium]|nr:hypothetical protein [Candidatus Gracilibacteria bacterium]